MGGKAQYGIAHAYAHITQYGAVGQVALPTGNRQFFGQKAQYGIGHTEVAFGVFKVDRIDFVRHGGRTDFACFDFLFEVTQRNVAPNIAVEVDQNRVDTADGLEEFRHIVVRLDLNGVGVEGQAEADFNKVAAMGFPIHIGISDHMGIVVADCAIDFAEELLRLQVFKLTLQAVHDIGDFFTQCAWCSRLAMRTAHHRDGSQLMRHTGQFFDNFGQFRQQNSLTRFLQH